MVCLVASLSTGKGTWIHVSKLIQEGTWDKIFLITNAFGKENFSNTKNAEMVIIDDNKNLEEIRDEIKKNLQGKLNDTEVAVNLISGSGKEHMAIISAILQLGYGVRLVASSDSGVKEI
ncbi:hypothetical protein J4440_01795 [Candidatus Woesearchaeota archaeon]|nr:hypothetical protein [Candidatus Woesearchaeota archaeon]